MRMRRRWLLNKGFYIILIISLYCIVGWKNIYSLFYVRRVGVRGKCLIKLCSFRLKIGVNL